MSHTNSTTNYGLPQWIGSDKPTFLGDFNSAFNTIDGQMKQNSTDAGQAINTANSANATAMDATERSITAKSTADTAKDTADAANALATTASNTATVAKNTADAAARTAQANNIGNLAPAYDPTLTYNVGDLVTYIDENNSGKLYKCIVAWETPGEFNINYWDDVTTSEVFTGDYDVVAEIPTTAGTVTQAFLKNSVYPAILSCLPLGASAADTWDQIKNTDIILATSNTIDNRIELFRLDLYTAHSGGTGHNSYPVFCFSEIGDAFPEAQSAAYHSIRRIICGEHLEDNIYEQILFNYEQITDPGNASIVTKTVTSITVKAFTYSLSDGKSTWRIYQRKNT